jgi:uncharacterized repeat protein (TIGR03806 family)
VYRGTEIPDLVGSYVYADYVTGEIWRLAPQGDGYENHALLEAGFNISSFGEGQDGELYAIDYGGGVYRFERGVTSEATSTIVPLLSLTGCVNPDDPTELTSAAVPYDVALPFWSDGVSKERYLALPDGAEMTLHPDGDIELPPGGVTIKNFHHDGRLIETRFYVRHDDGEHSGYSYAWREDGRDAELVTQTMTRRVGALSWTYPGRNQCNACHTAAAGRSLGLELAQLDIENSGVSVNQLDALRRLGMLGGTRGAALVFADDGADVEQRSRAYLHVNCSQCHRPGAVGRGGIDLRFDTPLEQSGLCSIAQLGALGTTGELLAPGNPEGSVLYARMNQRGENGMPPVASNLVDASGVSLMAEFITSLESCP